MTDILLFDYFGEYYADSLYSRRYEYGVARTLIVIDFDQAWEAKLEVDISELPGYIKDTIETYKGETMGGTLFCVSGQEEIEFYRLFLQMVSTVENGPMGGDDDTFDYWPGAIETLSQFAEQLYAEFGERKYIKIVKDLAQRNEMVPEWEGTAQFLGGEWMEEK